MSSYPHEPGHRGVDTSIEGGAKIARDLPELQHAVRGVIADRGAYGATGDEIAAALGWHRFRVRPRTSELRAADRIADSGKRRRNKASGVNAIVWVLPRYVGGEA